MYLDLENTFIILTLVCVALFWWQSLKIRDVALIHVKQLCKRDGLQLLDQSVAFRGMKPVLSPTTLFAFERRYRFEFSSTGEERYKGLVVLRGQMFVRFELPPYRLPDRNIE